MKHELVSVGRFPRGMTVVAPARPLYGTRARCSCGEVFRINEAPSRGGRKAVAAWFTEHSGGARA